MEKKKHRNRSILFATIYAVLFAAAMVFGAQLEAKGSIGYVSGKTWGGIFFLTLLSFLLTSGLFWLLQRYEQRGLGVIKEAPTGKKEDLQSKEPESAGTGARWYRQKRFWIYAGIVLLCWMPYFLASYPGFFLYDAETELNMVLTAKYTTHHPLAHVLLLGWTIKVIYKITGSYNAGIAVYIICQAVFTALSFSYILYRMKEWGIRRWIRVLGGLYFCIFPVIPMYALCSTKDVLFTVFLLLFLVTLADFRISGAAGALVLSAAAMLLLRNNGIYALVLSVPFLIPASVRRRKKLTLSFLAILAVYFVCSFGLKMLTNADDLEKQEMLSVPIQQLARVYRNDYESLNQSEVETLHQFLSDEALQRYRPVLSDPVKVAFDSEAYTAHRREFWRLWLSVGMEHPAAYLNAFLVNNYGFWYPYASLNCYQGNRTYSFVYEDSSYFGYETERPGERSSLIPALDEFVRKLSLEISWQKIPGVRILFHPAFYFWMFLFGLCYQLSQGRYRMCAYGLPILFLYLTVLLGPAVLVRYVLYFYFGFPLLLAFVFGGREVSGSHCPQPKKMINEEI